MSQMIAEKRSFPFAELPLAALRAALALRIRKSPAKSLEDEVLRLAELSPHLLRDVGFREVTPGAGVWCDGHHRVAVPRADPADRLLRIGRV